MNPENSRHAYDQQALETEQRSYPDGNVSALADQILLQDRLSLHVDELVKAEEYWSVVVKSNAESSKNFLTS